MQFDKFLSRIFLLMSLLENATSPWGQSWERVLHKHACIQHLCLCKTLSQDCPHGEIRQLYTIYGPLMMSQEKTPSGICSFCGGILPGKTPQIAIYSFLSEMLPQKLQRTSGYFPVKLLMVHIVSMLKMSTYYLYFTMNCIHQLVFQKN